MKYLSKCLTIIGAGPAGMAAAIDADNSRLDFILIESNEVGWYAKYSINQHYKVDGYLGAFDTTGTELIENFKKHIESKEITIHHTNVINVEKCENYFCIICDDCIIHSQFVILASGNVPKKLYLENYENFLGKYIFNFVCKETLDFSNKNIVVLGGRNSGVTTALFLSKQTTSKVTLVEKDSQLNATNKYLERLSKTNVKCFTNANVLKINGKGTLESLDIEINGKIINYPLDVMFCCIGMKPNLKYCKNLMLDIDKDGRILVNPLTMETNINNLYAIGDINQLMPKQVSNATANGKTAVYFINKKYLEKRG